jgi:hypothetical protein
MLRPWSLLCMHFVHVCSATSEPVYLRIAVLWPGVLGALKGPLHGEGAMCFGLWDCHKDCLHHIRWLVCRSCKCCALMRHRDV